MVPKITVFLEDDSHHEAEGVCDSFVLANSHGDALADGNCGFTERVIVT